MAKQSETHLCATSRSGLWLVDRPGAQMIVFECSGEQLAFLLDSWQSRPAYTLVPLDGVNMRATYVGQVFIEQGDKAVRGTSHADLGRLEAKDGVPLISTLTESGLPMAAVIAPWLNKPPEDGYYGFNWWIMFEGPTDKMVGIVHKASPDASWLNQWRPPHWTDDEDDDDDDATLEMTAVELADRAMSLAGKLRTLLYEDCVDVARGALYLADPSQPSEGERGQGDDDEDDEDDEEAEGIAAGAFTGR